MKFTFRYLLLNNRDFSKHDAYVKIFAILFPIIPTWIILNFTKWTANTVTILGFIFGVTGAILGYFYALEFLLYGFLIFLVLDFVDGNVAIARGGGTFLGTILDMTSDRIILFLAAFVLINHHIINQQDSEIRLLLAYILSFVLLDILQLAFLRAKKSSGTNSADSTKEKPKSRKPNNFKKIISNPVIWSPSRLSSYLFMMAIIIMTGSFAMAYCVGIVCVVGEYVTTIFKYSKMFIPAETIE